MFDSTSPLETKTRVMSNVSLKMTMNTKQYPMKQGIELTCGTTKNNEEYEELNFFSFQNALKLRRVLVEFSRIFYENTCLRKFKSLDVFWDGRGLKRKYQTNYVIN